MNAFDLRNTIKAIGVAALLCAPMAHAEVTLTPDAMKQAALISLRGGDAGRALVFADALIARDASDFAAHLLRARALRDLGRNDAAIVSARQGWSLSKNPAQRYSSALIMAQALSSGGKKTRAQLWLRRAVQNAPTPALKAKAARDFGYVRQRNPWSTQLSFTLAPNSNINNGSSRDTSQLNYVFSDLFFGGPVDYLLTGASRALSGLEYGASIRTRYRFSQTATTAHDLQFSASYRSFVLSGSAKSIAPDVAGDDFAFGSISAGYGYKRLNYNGKGEFSGNVDLGQTFYGGARYASYLRGNLRQSYKVNARDQLRFTLMAEAQDGQRTTDTQRLEFATSFSRRLKSGDSVLFEASVTGQTSAQLDAEYGEIELRAAYAKAKPVFGAGLQFGLGAAFRDYDVSPHSIDGRKDKRVFADITATFKDIDYYGFNPTVTFTASSTDSNIGLFDVNRFGISLGVRSAF